MNNTTTEYRLAMGGEGPLANTYKDKPHRLVYNLANAVDNLREVIRVGHAELERLNELAAEGIPDAPDGATMIVMRDALTQLDVTTSELWKQYLENEQQEWTREHGTVVVEYGTLVLRRYPDDRTRVEDTASGLFGPWLSSDGLWVAAMIQHPARLESYWTKDKAAFDAELLADATIKVTRLTDDKDVHEYRYFCIGCGLERDVDYEKCARCKCESPSERQQKGFYCEIAK